MAFYLDVESLQCLFMVRLYMTCGVINMHNLAKEKMDTVDQCLLSIVLTSTKYVRICIRENEMSTIVHKH